VAGLHFSCGDWLGNDKSAGPIFLIIMEVLPEHLRENERQTWDEKVDPFFWEPIGEPANQVQIPLEIMQLLIEPARRYRARLAKRLKLSGPNASASELSNWDIGDFQQPEFRYYCLVDFERAFEESCRTGEPVKVTFC
jgi:hypothetical protein